MPIRRVAIVFDDESRPETTGVYCRRARQAGFRTVVAQDAFVHHFGSVTFRSSNIDVAELLRKNQQKFQEKWNQPETSSSPPAVTAWAARPRFLLDQAPGGGLRLTANTIQLSLCMIVRDNAEIIEECLTSIRPWVDEMIVVDTGSQDATPEIARALGARVYHFPWCDSFSAARNESLRYARGEWIFWMDSDDTIDADNGRKLRELADGPHPPHRFGYVLQVHCPGAGDDGRFDVTAVDHVKLFRNRPGLRLTPV